MALNSLNLEKVFDQLFSLGEHRISILFEEDEDVI